jgi:hypothetical protein
MTPLLPVLLGGNKWKKYKMKIMREEKMLGEKKKGTHGHIFISIWRGGIMSFGQKCEPLQLSYPSDLRLQIARFFVLVSWFFFFFPVPVLPAPLIS